MEYFKFKDNTFEAEEINGVLVFKRNVDVSRLKLKSLLELPWASRPWEVIGNFRCTGNELSNLKGAPKFVKGDFDCYANNLTSLEGAPKSVGGDFICSYNELKSLEGAPESVKGAFNCYNNNLKNLRGAPMSVGCDIYCSGNKLKRLGLTEIPRWEGKIKSDKGKVMKWIKGLLDIESAALNISHPNKQIRNMCIKYLEGG